MSIGRGWFSAVDKCRCCENSALRGKKPILAVKMLKIRKNGLSLAIFGL